MSSMNVVCTIYDLVSADEQLTLYYSLSPHRAKFSPSPVMVPCPSRAGCTTSTRTPKHQSWPSFFCAVFAMLLGLLSFAGTAAIGAIFTMGVVCTYTAYSIPIAARHLGGQKFTPGPFSLGFLVSFTS